MTLAAGLRSAYRSASHQAWRYNSAWSTASRAAANAASRRCASVNAQGCQGAFKHFHQKKQSVHEAIKARLKTQPSILDFSPRFQYRRLNGNSTRVTTGWQHERARLRQLLLEAYVGRSLRYVLNNLLPRAGKHTIDYLPYLCPFH